MMLQTRLVQKFPIDKSSTRRWSVGLNKLILLDKANLIISSKNKISSPKMYSIARLNDLCLNEEIPVD